MRSAFGTLLSVVSTGLIVAGLYLSLPRSAGIEVIDRPGRPVKIVGEIAQSVAYFEPAAGGLEVTIIVSEASARGGALFKTRVRLADGQSHTLAVNGDEPVRMPERFTFRRIGQTVEMSVEPAVLVVSAGLSGH